MRKLGPDSPLPDLTGFPLLNEAVRTGQGIDDVSRFRFAVDVFLAGLVAFLRVSP